MELKYINMEKEFIPYEQSLELKELGFDKPCMAYYTADAKQLSLVQGYNNLMFADYVHLANTVKSIPCPLYQQAFRWFREKYGLYSWVTMELGAALTFCWTITGENKGTEYKAFLKTHEEAELECLKKLIEICKNN